MQEITTLIATLILPATITTVPVCFVAYALKGRERPLRTAVDTAQRFVASGAVWLALVLASLYGVLESLDRWGVRTFVALMLGPSAVLGAVLAVVMIWRQQRRETDPPESSNSQSTVGEDR